MTGPRALAIATTLAAVAVAQPAGAEGPFELELATRVGAATSPGWVANPYALGFGGRAGISVYGFYGGIAADYYVGGSFGASGFHTLLLGVEAGYTFKLRRVRVRPQVVFGDGTFTQEASDGMFNPPMSTSVGNVYLEPGVVVLVPVGPIFVGGDANALLLPGFTLATADGGPPGSAKTYASFAAHAQVGVLF